MGSALLEFPHILLTVYFNSEHIQWRGFPDGAVVKNPSANAGDAGTQVPSLGMAAPSSVLAWEAPWTEESGGLQSMGSQS